jgi:hypothetical protein
MLFFCCFFRFVSVFFGCFETGEKNRNKNLLVSRNKPKINRNRFSFGLFRFEPKIFFVCFENTLVAWGRVEKKGVQAKDTVSYYMIPIGKGCNERKIPSARRF